MVSASVSVLATSAREPTVFKRIRFKVIISGHIEDLQNEKDPLSKCSSGSFKNGVIHRALAAFIKRLQAEAHMGAGR